MATTPASSSPMGTPRLRRRVIMPDMSPMAGIGFLLVSFFMLTSSLQQPTLMELAMPVKPSPDAYAGLICGGTSVMTILLGAQNRVYYYPGLQSEEVRTTDFSAAGLRQVLLSAQQTTQGVRVLLKPADQATYQNIVDALDELRITGHRGYALTDLSPADKDLLRSL